MTADDIAGIWTDVLGHDVRYPGADMDAFETAFAENAPGWFAYDMRLMFSRFQRDGMTATSGDDAKLQALLGRPMRSYRDFATEAAASWTA